MGAMGCSMGVGVSAIVHGTFGICIDVWHGTFGMGVPKGTGMMVGSLCRFGRFDSRGCAWGFVEFLLLRFLNDHAILTYSPVPAPKFLTQLNNLANVVTYFSSWSHPPYPCREIAVFFRSMRIFTLFNGEYRLLPDHPCRGIY